MRKLNLTEWAAAAEIFGTVAIIVSLIFVAYSVNQNTAAMQASNDNFLYELQFARGRDIVSSPGMATLYAKLRRNEELSEEEYERFYWDKLQDLSSWELAFNRHRDGLFSTTQWDGWDNYFETTFVGQFPKESWTEVREWYADDFAGHVDAAYARKSAR
jgi:hypothetical protein